MGSNGVNVISWAQHFAVPNKGTPHGSQEEGREEDGQEVREEGLGQEQEELRIPRF